MKKSLLLSCILCYGMVQAQTELLFKPEVGKTYKATAQVDILISMSAQGQHLSMPTKTDVYYDMLVKGIDANGDVHIEYKTTRVLFEATDPQTKKAQQYDSDKPQNTAEYKAADEKFRASIGKIAKAHFNNKAELMEADSNVSEMHTEPVVKLPADKIKVGSTWQDSKTVQQSGMEINTKTTYTISKIEAGLVHVQSSTSSEMMKDPMKGSFIIDSKTGLVKSSTATGLMDMSMMTMKIASSYTLQ